MKTLLATILLLLAAPAWAQVVMSGTFLMNGTVTGGGLPDQTGHAGEYLTTNGTTTSWAALAGGGDVVASGTLTLNSLLIGGGGTTAAATATAAGALAFLGTASSANFAALVTGETGTGAVVFGTSPTLTTPVLGVATATSINGNTFTTGTYTLTGAAGKTLTFSNTLTLAGTDGTTMTFPGTSATIARTDAANTFTGTQTLESTTSLLLGTAGSAVGNIGFRNATSGTITLAPTTGALGTVTQTLQAVAGTIYSTGGTDVAVADGGTGLSSGTSGGVLAFTASGTLASSGALAANAIVIGGGAGVAPSTTTTGSGVLTALAIAPNATGGVVTAGGPVRITAITSSATPTYNTDSCDVVNITALAAAITSMTSSRTGTLADFQQVEFRIKDDGTARAITWGADFASGIATLPTTTILGKTLYVYCEYDTVTGDLMCQATGSYP